ncbi:hypothetical protein PFLUOLIPICF7_18365 [Pseudomonas simiae]|uniref:Uncharacterized protein n=1 Tax=Pseudomonas simiae TaxID=321846 RepID=U1UWZ8_9PSED|nr:hypothetical protein PFLUOLIPICF7_18365 [Pseudomonas simiae]ERH60833.1 hypothetical protein O204_16565 [Pseudomonas simiae]
MAWIALDSVVMTTVFNLIVGIIRRVIVSPDEMLDCKSW